MENNGKEPSNKKKTGIFCQLGGQKLNRKYWKITVSLKNGNTPTAAVPKIKCNIMENNRTIKKKKNIGKKTNLFLLFLNFDIYIQTY